MSSHEDHAETVQQAGVADGQISGVQATTQQDVEHRQSSNQPEITSRWVAESDDGRYAVDCDDDGDLMIVDREMLAQQAEEGTNGLFPIARWNIAIFFRMMRLAAKLHRIESAAARNTAKAARCNGTVGISVLQDTGLSQ